MFDVLLIPQGYADVELSAVELQAGRTTDLGTLIALEGLSLGGVVADDSAEPIEHATVLASWTGHGPPRSRRTLTDSDGRYRFRTIRPVPYSGRTPHIHFRIYGPEGPALTSQMYVAGEPRNAHDGIYGRLSEAEQARVTVPLEPIGEAAWRTRFDIVLPGAG